MNSYLCSGIVILNFSLAVLAKGIVMLSCFLPLGNIKVFVLENFLVEEMSVDIGCWMWSTSSVASWSNLCWLNSSPVVGVCLPRCLPGSLQFTLWWLLVEHAISTNCLTTGLFVFMSSFAIFVPLWVSWRSVLTVLRLFWSYFAERLLLFCHMTTMSR